jgi:hypothetical protein
MHGSKAEAYDIGVHILEKAMNPSKHRPFQTRQCMLPRIGNPAGPGGSRCSSVFLSNVALAR